MNRSNINGGNDGGLEGKIGKEDHSRKYSVAVIGTGNIGREVATCIVGELNGRFERLFLSNRDAEKADSLKEQLLTKNLEKGGKIKIEVEDYMHLDEILDADITVITAGVGPPKEGEGDRDVTLRTNLPIIRELAKQYKGYKNIVLVVTTPVDTLSHVFSLYSGVNPSQVIGLNQLDTTRLRGFLQERLSQSFQQGITVKKLYVLGGHDTGLMVPIYSNASFDNWPISASPPSPEFLEDCFRSAERAGLNRWKGPLKSTEIDTGGAVVKVIESILDENQIVVASSFMHLNDILGWNEKDENDRGLFIGYPVKFQGLRSVKQYLELSDSEKQQITRVYRKMEGIIDNCRKGGMIEGYVTPVEEEAEPESIKLHHVKPRLQGHKLFAASGGQVYILDLEQTSQKPETSLNCVNSAAYVDFSQVDGKPVLLVGTKDVQIWSLEGMGKLEKVLKVHNPQHRIKSIATAFGGRQLLFGASMDRKVYMWDLEKESSRPEMEFKGASYGLNGIVVVGNYLVGAGDKVYVWDINRPEKPISEFSDYFARKEFTCLSHNATIGGIYAGSKGGFIYSLVFEEEEELGQNESRNGPLDISYNVNCLDSSIDDLAASVFGGGVYGWRIVHTAKSVITTQRMEYQGSAREILAVKIAEIEGQEYLFAGGIDHNVYMWNFNQPERPLKVFNLEHKIESIAVGRL